MPSSPLRVAVVCMSNMNRSMEALSILMKKGFSIRSFGMGSLVRFPRLAPKEPVAYDFSTSYKMMHKDFSCKDRKYYKGNGVLHILGRNERIKPHPERFQECRDPFNVIFTCAENVYDRVVADMCARDQETCQPVHVINVDIEDTLELSTLGSLSICELCQGLQPVEDMEGSLAVLLQAEKEKTGSNFLHTVCFY
ncbi:RNA polymerase II subunit A C-terminal domain phosphatase SSU72 like protein 3-like [Balaenoptera ricei]|uniref:RNA polymerase II subunit A C-terminal domain phosphatase SSU72 like protein 3-like n=1 Tax=Balaenoptera ricei TaxID=2746895 RepID=UPI0028BF0FB0|nr:RNA polymerase II subunit A C-terminal domain phosphatase SSU72 like protein 3-like [Balaenoptera ricei]